MQLPVSAIWHMPLTATTSLFKPLLQSDECIENILQMDKKCKGCSSASQVTTTVSGLAECDPYRKKMCNNIVCVRQCVLH